MPWNEVPAKFAAGTLRSGGPSGPKVRSRAQMQAILLSEKSKAASGDTEYQSPATKPATDKALDGLRKAKG